MRLTDLRAYVANILDYSPDVTAYKDQIDAILNDAYRRLFSEKPFLFAQKSTVLTARQDITAAIVVINGNSLITSATLFKDYMAGHVISINDTEYTIAWVKDTSNAYLTIACAESSGAHDAVVRFRWLDFPEDMISCLQVIKRSQVLTPQEPGRMMPLTRYEDEWYNLPLNEVNMPRYWVPYDDYSTPSPINVAIDVFSSSSGHGTRTLCFRMAFLFAERRISSLSSNTDLLLTNTKKARLTLAAMPNTSGLYRRLYVCNKGEGLAAYRAVADDSGMLNIPPDFAGTKEYTLPYSLFAGAAGESFAVNNARYTGEDGNRQRFRLYPRQSADYEITIRYLYLSLIHI